MNKIICLVGESGSGKTTLCKELEKEGYNIIKSYTTRKPRSENEYGHTFITRDEIVKKNIIVYNPTVITLDSAIRLSLLRHDIIAYTFFDGEHYFATKEQYQGKEVSIYVIDVAGAKDLKERVKDAEIVVIYLKTDRDTRLLRMIREGKRKNVAERMEHDKEAFEIVQCDYCVNADRSIKEVLKDIKKIIGKYEP